MGSAEIVQSGIDLGIIEPENDNESDQYLSFVSATFDIPSHQLFLPRHATDLMPVRPRLLEESKRFLSRLVNPAIASSRWSPALVWTDASWLAFWYRDRSPYGSPIWEQYIRQRESATGSPLKWEDIVDAWDEMLGDNQLPIVFLYPKDEDQDWERPEAFAVVRTMQETERYLGFHINTVETLRVVPVEPQQNGTWRVHLDDEMSNRIARTMGATGLFHEYHIAADRESVTGARQAASGIV